MLSCRQVITAKLETLRVAATLQPSEGITDTKAGSKRRKLTKCKEVILFLKDPEDMGIFQDPSRINHVHVRFSKLISTL